MHWTFLAQSICRRVVHCLLITPFLTFRHYQIIKCAHLVGKCSLPPYHHFLMPPQYILGEYSTQHNQVSLQATSPHIIQIKKNQHIKIYTEYRVPIYHSRLHTGTLCCNKTRLFQVFRVLERLCCHEDKEMIQGDQRIGQRKKEDFTEPKIVQSLFQSFLSLF